MIQRDCPCTQTCPDRSSTCRLECKAWKEYEVARNARYEAARTDPEYQYVQYLIGVKRRIIRWKNCCKKRRV